MSPAATFHVRLTHTNDFTRENGRPAWSEWIGLSKTGKAVRKTSAAKATALSATDAQALAARISGEIAAALALRNSTGQITVVEVVAA
jgi:hypothetical protein